MYQGKVELKNECLRLREEEHLSLREIHERTGASKGILSLWLKGHPLPPDVLRLKREPRQRRGGPKKERGEESKYYQLALKLDANQRAKVAEVAVLLRLTLQGFEVFRGVQDGAKADWVVQVPATNKLWRVQVKLAGHRQEGLPFVSLRCSQSAKKYSAKEVDFVAGYDLFTDIVYVWSWAEVDHLATTITVHPDAAERWDKFISG